MFSLAAGAVFGRGVSVARGTSFALTDVGTRRIFTPNGDGVNDRFLLTFDNPGDSVVSVAKIYDVSGAEVADFELGNGGTTLEWDGKDGRGKSVRAGVYLYRIDVEGTVHSGTVVVAR